MHDIDTLTEDFSVTPVPQENLVSGFRVAMVIIGFTITLPIFIAGSSIGFALGLHRASSAFVYGGLILAVVGLVSSYIGSTTRLSTYVITQFAFGRTGALLVNGIIAIALFGWYGVTAELFGRACQQTLHELYGWNASVALLSCVGSAMMILTAMWGFKALDKLSVAAVPLMMALLATAVFFSLRMTTWAEIGSRGGGQMSVGSAISMVVGSFIVGAILLPDLCRYARRTWEGMAAAGISLGIVFPAVFYCAMIPSLATRQNDLVLIMIGLGIGLPALFLLVVATWSTNSHNLYSTSLTIASLFPRIAKWKLTVAAGVIGTAAAAAGITNHFVDFLIVLGTAIPPIVGIYASDFILISARRYDVAELAARPAVNPWAFLAWMASTAFAFLSDGSGVSLTGIVSLDSIVCSSALYVLFTYLGGSRRAASRLIPRTVSNLSDADERDARGCLIEP